MALIMKQGGFSDTDHETRRVQVTLIMKQGGFS